MKIKEMFQKYNENASFISELNIKTKNSIKSLIMGYGLSLLIILTPVILIYNLFIYSQLQNILIISIVLLVWAFFMMSDIFYHRSLALYEPKIKEISLKTNYLLNACFYLIVCMIVYVAIMLFI